MSGPAVAVALAVALGAVLLLGRARDGWRGPAVHVRGRAPATTAPRAPRLRSALAAFILVAGMAVAIAIEVGAALATP